MNAIRLLVLVVMVLGSGCGKKKNLDQHVDKLLDALHECDYEVMKDISHASLLADMPTEKFQWQCKVMKKLGKITDRTMKGINVKSGGVSEGKYSIELEKARAELEISLKDDKLIAFKLTGDHVQTAVSELRAEKFKDFKVHQFAFTTPAGEANPKGNVYAVGSKVHYKLVVGGVTPKDGKVLLKGDLVLQNAAGESKKLPGVLDVTIDHEKGQVPAITLNGQVDVPKGTHTMQLLLSDSTSGKTLTYSQAVTMQ